MSCRTIRKLTFVSDGPFFGGAERYMVSMAEAARRRGMDSHIHWMPCAGARPDVFDGARDAGIAVTKADSAGLSDMVRGFRQMLCDRRPDGMVINACGRRRFWMLPWLAWQAGIPTVWVHQMVDGRDHRLNKPRWMGGRVEGPQLWRVPQALRHRLAAIASTAVVTLNAEDRERIVRWQGVDRDKIRVIPHGVDCNQMRFDEAAGQRLRRELDVPADAFVVGTAGRLVAGKGMGLLLDAVALCRQKGVDMVAIIAGQGECRESLEQQARQLGIADSVRFASFISDMVGFYSALDVFALCSTTDSFGLALAEAMACECAVVGTPTAGAQRQIRHLDNGWQLQGFGPEELASALCALHADQALRERLGSQARPSVVQQFSIELNLERTLRALRGRQGERSRLCWPGMNEPLFLRMATEDRA